MFIKAFSAYFKGLKPVLCEVECSLTAGLPCYRLVGVSSSSAIACMERARAALKNSSLSLPAERISVNVRPAIPSSSSSLLDLPIVLSLLGCARLLPESCFSDTLFVGELSLDGKIVESRGLGGAKEAGSAMGRLLLRFAREQGFRYLVMPAAYLPETEMPFDAGSLEGRSATPLSFDNLSALLDWIRYKKGKEPDAEPMRASEQGSGKSSAPSRFEEEIPNLRDIKGQAVAKRGALLACAGFHNLLLLGPPGIGKTMLARAMSALLPPPDELARAELIQLYALSEELPPSGSPFRAPHHSLTAATLFGGGASPRPGEVSLANGGILFLDELSEYSRDKLEALRMPLEEHFIRLDRLRESASFPADFMLVAGMNPCPCGYYPDRGRCKCTEAEVTRYLKKISGPLLDRVELVCSMYRPSSGELFGPAAGYSSAEARDIVMRARLAQKERASVLGIPPLNARLSLTDAERVCDLSPKNRDFLERAFDSLKLSPRSYKKVLCLARTIADVNQKERVGEEDLAEALQYRADDIFGE